MKKKQSLTLGFLAGALGGAIGTLALNLFQTASLKATKAAEEKFDTDTTYTQQQQALLKMFEKAHTRTAEAVTSAAGIDLSRTQRAKAALVTEFAFGVLCAGVYGALAEVQPSVTAGGGTLYGAGLFTGASLMVLPAMGYVPPPKDRTLVQHLGGLSGNVLYGAVTELVRTFLRSTRKGGVMDLKKYNVVVRRFDPEQGPTSGEEFVLPVDSPDEEHAVSAAMSNAIAFTTKIKGGMPLPVAFTCKGVQTRS